MKAVFFKVIRPINECLHPLLSSFMKSWIISTKWRVLTLCPVGTVEIYVISVFKKNKSQCNLFYLWSFREKCLSVWR